MLPDWAVRTADGADNNNIVNTAPLIPSTVIVSAYRRTHGGGSLADGELLVTDRPNCFGGQASRR